MGEYENGITRVRVRVPIVGPHVGLLPLRRLPLTVNPCNVGCKVAVFDHTSNSVLVEVTVHHCLCLGITTVPPVPFRELPIPQPPVVVHTTPIRLGLVCPVVVFQEPVNTKARKGVLSVSDLPPHPPRDRPQTVPIGPLFPNPPGHHYWCTVNHSQVQRFVLRLSRNFIQRVGPTTRVPWYPTRVWSLLGSRTLFASFFF